jgi:hypothetical protein
MLARGGRLASAVSDRVRVSAVHALQLPAHRDVQQLDIKVERLQRALEETAAQQRDADGGT